MKNSPGKATRPIIGITPSYTKDGFIRMRPAYLDSVWRAGGLPVFLSYTEDPEKLDEYTALFDGLIFGGGVDVDPVHYGEKVKFDSVEICAGRDTFELALCRRAADAGLPVLGICRGIQLMNVALGGSLHQHIEGHSQSAGVSERTQKIKVVPNTPLSEILSGKSELSVNTFHHQALKTLAPCLREAARAEDGICECVYAPEKRFFLGVQWHPELLEGWDSEALFGALVGAAIK